MKIQSYFQHSNTGSVIQSSRSKVSIKGEKISTEFQKDTLCNINSLSGFKGLNLILLKGYLIQKLLEFYKICTLSLFIF